jgi:hypothetical protein
MKYIKLLLVVFLFPFSLHAQVVFSEVGGGLSSWTRFYSSPDETILLVNPSQKNGSTTTVVMPSIYAKVDLGKTFNLRGRVGYAQNSFKSSLILGDLARNEELVQTILPAEISLEFRIPLSRESDKSSDANLEDLNLKDYNSKMGSNSHIIAGIGLSRYFIQHSFSRNVIGGEGPLAKSKFSGNDFGLTAILGYSRLISDRIVFTFLSQFNTGSYDHRLYSEDVIGSYEVKNISLQGLEFGVIVGYKLK